MKGLDLQPGRMIVRRGEGRKKLAIVDKGTKSLMKEEDEAIHAVCPPVRRDGGEILT